MSVAQLDRVTASDAVGSGFDSRRAHQNGSHPHGWLPFWHTRRKRTRRVRASEATLRRLVAGKAPWQAARYACRLACCACRSSSQKSRFAAIFGSPVITPLGVSADSQIHPKRQPPLRVAALLYARRVLRTRRVRASEATLRRLVAGKAPWQAARYACRLACCACRSSSQKSRFAAIFGSPVFEPRSRSVSF